MLHIHPALKDISSNHTAWLSSHPEKAASEKNQTLAVFITTAEQYIPRKVRARPDFITCLSHFIFLTLDRGNETSEGKYVLTSSTRKRVCCDFRPVLDNGALMLRWVPCCFHSDPRGTIPFMSGDSTYSM
jgi:hypothetical protein